MSDFRELMELLARDLGEKAKSKLTFQPFFHPRQVFLHVWGRMQSA